MITAEGGRVLGCLVEKQLTTPQQYPLTLNALTTACNQATNREPVMTLEDHEVLAALDELKAQRLVRFVLPSHGKSVVRYRHVLDEAHGLDTARVALLAVLLLRGPQTVGELRARTGRMAEYDSASAVEAELYVLVHQPEPLAELLARQPGQKEERWRQLLAEEYGGGQGVALPAVPGRGTSREAPDATDRTEEPVSAHPSDRSSDFPDEAARRGPGVPSNAGDRLDALEAAVDGLRAEVSELRQTLDHLRASLGE
jgi:uncharacterized protein